MTKRPASPLAHIRAVARASDPQEAGAFFVFSSPTLLYTITSFQGGLCIALYEFWKAQEPHNVPHERVNPDTIAQLLYVIVQYGSSYHLQLLQSSQMYVNGQWRVPNVSGLARLAVQNHRVDLLEWVISNNIPLGKTKVLWKVAIENCPKDDVGMLELLQAKCGISPETAQNTLRDANIQPTVTLLLWLKEKFPTLRLSNGLTRVAAADGDLDGVRTLLEQDLVLNCDQSAFIAAYDNHHFAVLEYLLKNHADVLSRNTARKLVDDPRAEIQALVTAYPDAFEVVYRSLMFAAVRYGDVIKMHDLLSSGKFRSDGLISIDKSGDWVGLEGLTFLHEQGLAIATTEAMDFAAEKQRWDVVVFLHKHRSEGCTTRTADAVAKAENLEVLKFLVKNRLEGSSASMDCAAEHGSMAILRYLHQYSKVGCTTKAMDGAASQGYLQVVKFLHENRSEGCTTDAMDNAAQNGYYEIVRYLCEHRKEGCTIEGIKCALKNNHLRIVHLLYKQYPDRFGPELLNDLLLRGAFEIFMTLRNKYPEAASKVIEPVMYQAATELELRTIVYIANDLGRTDLREWALYGTTEYRGADQIQWRKAVDAITSPASMNIRAIQNQLHPFLQDPRTPRWALDIILASYFSNFYEEYNQHTSSMTWAVRAVHHRDPSLFEVLRDIPPGTEEPRIGGYVNPNRVDDPFSFVGARDVAIRLGEVSMLEWLMTQIDYPIEPTLLSEAVYYHQFEIAEWLVDKYPTACTALDWSSKGDESGFRNFGLHDDLLDWLEDHKAIREALMFEGIVDFTARMNDVVSLKRLYDWCPEHFEPRAVLIELADLEECREAINFFLDIGWSAEVFLH